MALLPILRRRAQHDKEVEDQALEKALSVVATTIGGLDGPLQKAFLSGNAAKMPGTSWSNQGTINNVLLARVTQNLAQSFGRAPAELEAALAQQGLSWGPPFPPGRPLDPFWGYKRPLRTWTFAVGENVQLTPRWNRISFGTLKAITESYYAAVICIRHLTNDVRSLDYQFVPPNNVQEDATDDLKAAEDFFRYPDRRQPFRAWLAEWMQDILRYDAGCLYIRRNEAGEPYALEVVSGPTMIPLVDFFGRPPMTEPDEETIAQIKEIGGQWDGQEVPAYLQIIEGLPWVWSPWSTVIYQPWFPMPDSQYGLAPMEAVLMQANTDIRFQWHFLQYFCYDSETEVLTRDGWRKFDALDGSEEYATRSSNGEFEWQHSKDGLVHRFDYDGHLVKFANQCVDQVVTPNHRMLVRRLPATSETTRNHWHEWHIRQAQYFVDHPTAEFQLPVLSEWNEGIPPSVPPCGMPSWAWARFLGIYVAEGWRRPPSPGGKNRWEISVSQLPGGDLDEVRRILKDTGLNWNYNTSRGVFTVGCKELWLALEGTGSRAWEKRLPNEVLDWDVPHTTHLLHGLMVGDGHTTASGQRVYTTTSPVLADQVQVLWQHVGTYAAVWETEPHLGTMGKRTQYLVRTRPEDAFRVPRPLLVPYKGVVSCVSVPNGIILTRRHGKIVWSGNTTGTVPAGFMEAPPDLSNPAQVQEWQETWDAFMLGDQSKLRQVRWVPNGSKFTPVKTGDFNAEFPLYLMRCTAAAFGVTPNDLGFTETVNRSTGTVQVDVQFRVGTLPLVRHVEDILNAFIAQHLKLQARIQFDIGQEIQDRLVSAQVDDILIKNGTISQTEARIRRGYRVSRERPTGRFVDNTRSGPVPLISIHSLQGKIDPTTFGPAKDQDLLDHPFIPVPGTTPAIGSPAYSQAQAASANVGANMLIQNEDPRAPGRMQVLSQSEPADDANEAAKALAEALEIIDLLLKTAADNTGGPGVTRGFSNPITEGVTAETGAQGVDLETLDEQREDDEDRAQKALTLRRWRENSKNRVKKGLSPKRFEDTELPEFIVDRVWKSLKDASTVEEVSAAFASLGKATARSPRASSSRQPTPGASSSSSESPQNTIQVRLMRAGKSPEGN